MTTMKLDTWLAHQGLSQRAFAKMIGFSQQAVTCWINGDYRPGMTAIVKIEKATKGKVRMEDLLKIPQKELSTDG